MKTKLLLTVLCFMLVLSSCKSRVDSTKSSNPEETADETHLIPEESSKPETSEHTINDPEQISETITVVSKLLDKAKTCDLVYTGAVGVNEDAPTQTTDGTDNYYYVDSEYNSITAIEKLWISTFVSDGKARECYDKMLDDKLYMSFNGELYIKEHSADLAPMTMGEWEIETIAIKAVENDTIIVEMQTKLVGEEHGVQELTLQKIDDNWLLTDSYFLD